MGSEMCIRDRYNARWASPSIPAIRVNSSRTAAVPVSTFVLSPAPRGSALASVVDRDPKSDAERSRDDSSTAEPSPVVRLSVFRTVESVDWYEVRSVRSGLTDSTF